MPALQRGQSPEPPEPAPDGCRSGWWTDLVRITRPYQWPKSLLVVPSPLLYPEPVAWTPAKLAQLGNAVLVFIIASAVVYVGNDILDRRRDRRHPTKRHRPLASGRLPVAVAGGFGGLLAAGLAVHIAVTDPVLAWPVGAYLALNAAYSCGLKHVPVLDLFIVAAGFNLRILAGHLVVALPVPGWLMACAFLLCLMMVLGKRRRELELSDGTHRPVLSRYSPGLIDQLLVVSAGLAATTFVLYLDRDAGGPVDLLAPLLLPLALLGLFRYLWLIRITGHGGDPVKALLGDRVLLTGAVLCLLVLVSTRGAVPALLAAIPGGQW